MKITNLKKMIRTSVAALGALVIVSCPPANADGVYAGGSLKDQPILPQLPNWQGFYIGGHVGGAWSTMDNNRNVFFDDNSGNGGIFGGGSTDGSGVFGGIQGGYNWQMRNCCWVLGTEIDLGGIGTDFGRTFAATGPAGNTAVVRFESNGGWYGDVTNRIGYAWNNSLLYVKGGFAWFVPETSIRETTFDNTGAASGFFSNGNHSEALTGWTAGAGLEYMVNPNWSLKVEYLYFDFGRSDQSCCFDQFNNDWRINRDLTVNSVKVGFNYIIRSDPAPLK